MTLPLRGALALLSVTALASCGPTPEQRDDAAVMTKINVLRRLPGGSPSADAKLVDELAKVDVTTPKAKRARDACVKAFSALSDTQRLTALASAGLDTASSADPADVIKNVQDASDRLEEAKTAMAECNEAAATIDVRP